MRMRREMDLEERKRLNGRSRERECLSLILTKQIDAVVDCTPICVKNKAKIINFMI